MKLASIVAAATLATTALAASAQTAPASAADHAAHHPAAAAAAPQSDGEVRRIDKEQGKVTLRHGPLQNLDMPAMTMVFKVADAKMLDALNEGDKVKFSAERVNGAIVVTAIQTAQ
jgi:Cu/Ag efflux protein CusF